MSKPLPVDILAREIPGRAALVAGGLGDDGEALQIVRDLHSLLEGDYQLSFKLGAEQRRQSEALGAKFTGRPMISKFPGRCAVCAKALPTDSSVLYDPDRRKVACVTCGEISR